MKDDISIKNRVRMRWDERGRGGSGGEIMKAVVEMMTS